MRWSTGVGEVGRLRSCPLAGRRSAATSSAGSPCCIIISAPLGVLLPPLRSDYDNLLCRALEARKQQRLSPRDSLAVGCLDHLSHELAVQVRTAPKLAAASHCTAKPKRLECKRQSQIRGEQAGSVSRLVRRQQLPLAGVAADETTERPEVSLPSAAPSENRYELPPQRVCASGAAALGHRRQRQHSELCSESERRQARSGIRR